MFKRNLQNKNAKKQLYKLLRDVRRGKDASLKYKKILFCPLNGTAMNTMREVMIGKSAELRGAEIMNLYLDSNLPSSEFYSDSKEKQIYKYKVSQNVRYSKKLAIQTVRTSKYKVATSAKLELNASNHSTLEYKGILIGDLVVPSIVRAFKSVGPEWDNPAFVQQLEHATQSAQILIDVYNKLLDDVQPDKIVMSHGVYISWGTLFRVAQKRGIPVDVYGSSYRKDTLRFYHETPNAPFPVALWPQYKGKSLTEAQNKIVDEYIATRETQENDHISLFDEKTEIPEALQSFVKANEDKPLFALFTNISWDAYAFSSGNNFDSMLEWLGQTIEYFQKHPEAALIVKAHPAEAFLNTPEKYRVREFVKQFDLTENIYFIDENANVKPFWLYPKINFGLIHISTVCIEMALKDMVVLTSGAKGHYSDNGFTLDPTDVNDYFKLLEGLKDGTNNWRPDQKAAREYLFYRFYRESLLFDVFDLASHNIVNEIKAKKVSDISKGNNEILDVICEGILNDGEYITSYE